MISFLSFILEFEYTNTILSVIQELWMPGVEAILVMIVAVVAMVLFVTEKVRYDLTAICVLALLLILRLLPAKEALYGFASPATATVGAMFVLSAGLVRTGLINWLGRQMGILAGEGTTRLVLVFCICIAGLSAFIVNTAVVAIFIPVAIALAHARNVSPSCILMPLSFASQFGGVCTLIGTSTNILMNSIAIGAGMAAFGLFEFAPLGLVMASIGIIYLMIVPRLVLPERKGAPQQVDKYRLADYLWELKVAEGSPLIDTTWAGSEPDKDDEIDLIKIIRDDKATWRASATTIREGDLLLIHGHTDKLIHFKDDFKLETRADTHVTDKHLRSDEVKLIEALVPPRSGLTGKTLNSSDFRRRYRCVVLAMQRRGKVLRDKLDTIRLGAGDTILIQGNREVMARLMESTDLIVISELTDFNLRKDRAVIALLGTALVVGLSVFNVVPIFVAALLGALVMVLGRCLTGDEVYEAIDWKVIFLLGGMLPLGRAIETSGASDWFAETVLGPVADMGPIAVLATMYIITAVLTEVMSNVAAAILLAPIALALATSLGVSPRPLLVAITFAASTSFATPIGYQTNTLVYAPGGYKFTDYARVGIPLNLIFWIVATLLIPLIWPF